MRIESNILELCRYHDSTCPGATPSCCDAYAAEFIQTFRDADWVKLPSRWGIIEAMRKIFPEYEDESDEVVERVWQEFLKLLREQK